MKKKKIEKVEVRSFSKNTDRVFNVIIGLFALSCIFPFIFVIVVSFTTETALMVNGYTLFPKEVSLDGYKFLYDFKGQLLNSFGVTVFITVVGTLINTTFTSTYAYAISRPNFKYRRFFTKFALLTMLFSAGMIPNYIVMTKLLGLKDTVWALILPMALSPFNIIVMRTFFKRTVPDAIIESARIDGASEFRIFIQIVLPLAVPGIATISLFAALAFWNDWFNALLYINSENLYPLQYLLMKIQSNLDYISQNVGLSGINSGIGLPKESARMAMVVLSTLPIAVSYPFFQKYFVSGLTIGGVKE
ncbi:carbohydrate ABC transporter permease [Erysipelothrix rhusiopathiae]|uniref:ABC transporter, permease protein n=1 Tax=Erysipelothrix rhusiopathiae ATCC 19414 TaxID=525280 RepID=E7FXW8_ERYRH|nr:carbohydrate ABC transporter permease [Erysipelothrix rhusiopathiae]EFY08342.1 ABC transporter, permease protein [Erysipelothrix rhusiopathiae ATCC 19414]MDE8193311.1 carbohydrate ABC transporter permease [Erysipelothrix rhusiopathiae]MDE8256133.1 carbohydrate ABC transporter permease [Erysipelothrix rhusiopathiae]MDE8339311.1 carbohydrate ABC transporter permease [Erysipelothrix rhusiopathiae]MDE8340673.1 carbohydrate ABC transporter permease [Erysipelothrix rhusiopathiae]